jgi:hypothetical protein
MDGSRGGMVGAGADVCLPGAAMRHGGVRSGRFLAFAPCSSVALQR